MNIIYLLLHFLSYGNIVFIMGKWDVIMRSFIRYRCGVWHLCVHGQKGGRQSHFELALDIYLL